jgi:hypothetical protein
VRAASANRMHSAALLRNWSKLGKSASISIHMGNGRAALQAARPSPQGGFALLSRASGVGSWSSTSLLAISIISLRATAACG